jgi:phosphoserine phosphatase RsbU/P
MENYFNLAPCIYFSTTDDGTIIGVNDTVCQRLGYTKEELMGKRSDLIFTVATRIFQQTHFFPLLKLQGYAEEIYITLLTKGNEQLPVLMNAKREIVNGKAVNVYVGIIVPNRKQFEDELIAARKAAVAAIDENKELMDARQQLQQHIEQLDRQMQVVNKQNAELRQFNRVVTHDLQEPIRKMFLFVNMLLDGHEHRGEEEIAEKIKRVSEQMRNVVSGLQQYIWLTEAPGRFNEIDFSNIIRSVQEQIAAEHPDADLVIEAEQIPSIQADAGQIQLLFYHLLSNVVRFKQEGKPAYVHISGTSLLLNMFRNIRDKYKYTEVVKLVIADRGVGFDAVSREQLFELFRRLHPQSGQGVGLALCKKIVENHGGTIAIDSKKDEGTIITVILPVSQVPVGSGAEIAAKDS